MSIWFLLWFVLALIIIGASVWSTIILIQQKKTWKALADKKGLIYVGGKFFESPSVEGVVDGYGISLFAATQQKEDSRKNRQVTVLQFNTNSPFIGGIGAGTLEMVTFLQSFDVLSPYEVPKGEWSKKHMIRVENKKLADEYFTEERVRILSQILSVPKSDVLALLDKQDGIFRFETSNPLHDLPKLEVLIQKIMARLEKLKLTEEEEKKFASEINEKPEEVKEEKTKKDAE